MNLTSENQEMNQYFSSLPFYIQENILNSNANLSSLQDLKQCAEAFTGELPS